MAVHGASEVRVFANSPVGFRRLAAWLLPQRPRQVVLEATGGYEQAALDALFAAGLPMVRANPRQVRDFAKAIGQLAKTDRLDARVLAHLAAAISLTPYQPACDWQRRLDSKAIAKLVGVAPLARDSGLMRGQRHVWGGRRQIRAVLYMASLTAIRYEPRLRDFYQALRARGKAAKVAIVATMRKLLVILNARMRDARIAQQQLT